MESRPNKAEEIQSGRASGILSPSHLRTMLDEHHAWVLDLIADRARLQRRVLELEETVDRQERQLADRSLKLRGVPQPPEGTR